MQHYKIVNNTRNWLRPNLTHFSGICLDRLREAMKSHSPDSLCPSMRNNKLS